MHLKHIIPAIAAIILICSAQAYGQDLEERFIYWADDEENVAYRGNPETSEWEETARLTPRHPLAFDLADGELIWSDLISGNLWRGDPQEEGEPEHEQVTNAISIQVDTGENYIYWIEADTLEAGRQMSGTLKRVGIEGNEPEVLAEDNVVTFRLDTTGNNLFWLESEPEAIIRSKTDGSERSEFITDIGNTRDLEIDSKNEVLFWGGQHRINRVGFDGSDQQRIHSESITDLAINTEEEELFWSQSDSIYVFDYSDAESDAVTITGSRRNIGQLSFCDRTETLYWLKDLSGGRQGFIMKAARSNDYQESEAVLTGFSEPGNFSVDPSGGQLYWTGTGHHNELITSDVDGSRVRGVWYGSTALTVPRMRGVFSFKQTDMLAMSISYIEYGLITFYQVLGDGSNFRSNRISEYVLPSRPVIAFDSYNDHWYWAGIDKYNRQRIFRAPDENMTSDEVEILIEDEQLGSTITGLALDMSGGNIYWAESSGSILKTGLNGGEPDTVQSDLGTPGGISMDVNGGKLYWTDTTNDAILRANLDGSGKEEVFTELSNPGKPYLTFENIGTSTEDRSAVQIPDEVELHQNYPNPFNPVTTISYQIPVNSEVTLEVYDLLGRRITTLVSVQQQAGRHEVTFDASNLASGTYIYRLEAGKYTETQQMMLVK